MSFKIKILILIFCLIPIVSEASETDRVTLIMEAHEHLRNWQPYKALPIVEEIRKLDKNDPFYFYLQAKINFYLGNYPEAKKFLEEFTKREAGWENNEEVARLKNLIQSTIKASEGFTVEERGHFIIRFKEGKDRVLLDPAFAALEKSYEEIGKALGYFPEKKTLVEIYPSSDTFIAASGISKEAVETSGTCALCNYNRILITSPRATLRGYRWLDTLCHEYVHYVVYKIAGPRTPLWMHEGMAKYLEKRWRQKEGRELNPTSENILAKRLQEDRLITFEEMTPSFAFLKTSQDVMLAFAQVMTTIEYLDKTGGMESIRMLLERLSEGSAIDPAIKDIFGMNIDEMSAAWKEYLKKKGLRTWPDLDMEELIFRDPDKDEDHEELEIKHIASKKVRNYVKLGDMLKNRQRAKAAVVEYTKAKFEAETLSPVLENKLAMSYYMAGESKRAKSILIKAERIFPEFSTTYVNLGSIYLQEEQFQEARDQLEEAKDINPFNPWVYQELIGLYKKTEKHDRAEAAFTALKILKNIHSQ